MFYLVTGTDHIKTNAYIHKLLDVLKSKRPDALVYDHDKESITQRELEHLVHSQGLFEQKHIVVLRRVMEDKELGGFILEHLKDIEESQNVFLLYEESLHAARKKKMTPYTQGTKDFSRKAVNNSYADFALADACGARNTALAWKEYVRQVKEGKVSEELHGMLFWQYKTILLASSAKSAQEAGLKPFVYTKAKKFVAQYSQEEIVSVLENLVRMYHEAHRGNTVFEHELEKFTLNLG